MTCWAAVMSRAQPGALVKVVAYPVGLNDLSYFTRAFKRQLGVCPSETRRAQDCLNEWRDCLSEWSDCPNATGLVRATLVMLELTVSGFT